MTYYLLLNDSHVEIGEESFGKFWPSDGLKALYKIMNETPEMLSEITIKTGQTQSYQDSLHRFPHESHSIINSKS
jgi:hypothetical protein